MKLNDLLKRCLRQLTKHPEYNNYPHWTFILTPKWELVQVGLNRTHEPSRKFGYHDHADPMFIPKLHAELDALRRCRRRPKEFIAANVRLNKSGLARMASPCRACRNLLWAMGCKKVYFTTPSGWEYLGI